MKVEGGGAIATSTSKQPWAAVSDRPARASCLRRGLRSKLLTGAAVGPTARSSLKPREDPERKNQVLGNAREHARD